MYDAACFCLVILTTSIETPVMIVTAGGNVFQPYMFVLVSDPESAMTDNQPPPQTSLQQEVSES